MNIYREKKGKDNWKRGRKKSVEEEEGEEVLKEGEILNYRKAQSLRAFAALAEGTGSVPSIHIGQFKVTSKSTTFTESSFHFWPPLHMQTWCT